MTAPIKTCDFCNATGVMPTFMDGTTVCYDCLPTLPKTLREAWREIVLLRTKIERMERQEPIAWTTELALRHGASALGFDACVTNLWSEKGVPLYTLPGAQPAPSEQDESVRKAWSRFSNELHRSPDAPYPGMSQAFEQHFSQSFADREWRVEASTWAAAWKAAKRHGPQPAPSAPDGWLPVPEKLPTFDPVDLQLSDGSVLCGCVPQADGDYWWEGPSGEVFIDPKYASVTHWRLAATPEAKP